MSSNTNSQLFFLKAPNSVHWFLFGVNQSTEKIYFLEIIGNESTKTRILSKQEARHLWKQLNDDGFEKIELRDAGAIPSHVDQRIREWSKFVYNKYFDKIYKHDPWGRIIVERNDAKTLSDIAQNKTFDPVSSEPLRIANFWECREPDDEYTSDESRTNIHGGDVDNYWNQEGIFESASDQGDERFAQMYERYEQGLE
jgi:hypothetical protein